MYTADTIFLAAEESYRRERSHPVKRSRAVGPRRPLLQHRRRPSDQQSG